MSRFCPVSQRGTPPHYMMTCASRERSRAGTGGDDLDENFELSDEADGDGSGGGGSEDDDEGSGSDEDAGDGPLQKRQKQRAAGNHELQAKFRCRTA